MNELYEQDLLLSEEECNDVDDVMCYGFKLYILRIIALIIGLALCFIFG